MNKKNIIKLSVVFLAILILVVFTFWKNKEKINLSKKEKGQVFQGEKANTKKEINLLFVGDIMCDRHIRDFSEKFGNDYILTLSKEKLAKYDDVIGNLEGPITEKPSVSQKSAMGEKNNFIFTCDPSWAETLEKNNIQTVNLGNNHILNFGAEGLRETENSLEKAQVNFFGAPEELDKHFLIKNIKNRKIAFVTFNQFEANGFLKTQKAIEEVKTFQPEAIILYAHWDKEYEKTPTEKTVTLAHNFIDEGVDLIIGTHPHVVQEQEEYKAKKIYYSLGNFIFDQYFSPETQGGLAVEVKITSSEPKIITKNLTVDIQKNGQTTVND